MAVLKRGMSAMKAGIVSRFATPASRFRFAVTTGFTLVAVGVFSAGAGGIGFADDLFGGLGALFGLPSPTQYAQPYGQSPYTPRAAAASRRQPRSARRYASKPKLTVRLASAKGTALHAPSHGVRIGGLSMCVRTCDGFAFPVGTYHGEQDRAAHEATCQNECPGARTALYVLPGGADTIGDAVEVKSGRNYSEMPAAFHYTTFLTESCSCHPREGNRISSLLRDFTLRRGDAVMTKTGFKVFHGGEHFPHRQNDFVALSVSKDVHEHQRANFRAIERASHRAPANVAERPAVAPLDAPKKASLPALEKQASLAP